MKKILVCTNCQGDAIIKYLRNIPEFTQKYSIDWIKNWVLVKTHNKQPYLDKLMDCDVFIYQPLKDKHGELSTETPEGLMQYLKPDCQLISFPYIYSSAYWPFFHHVSKGNEFHPGLSGFKITNHNIVADLLKTHTKHKIYAMYQEDKIDFTYKENFKITMDKLRENESTTTIKVVDYIVENYTTRRMFLTKDHPTKYILIYCANKILELLNINDRLDENKFTENYHGMPDSSYNRPDNKWPITEQCAKELGLHYYDEDAKSFWLSIIALIYK